MNCKDNISITTEILCAKVCKVTPNNPPEALFSYADFTLFDGSEYYDDGNEVLRMVNWQVYYGDVLIYNFGYGKYYEPILELNNSSIYSQLVLGENNYDIIQFLNTLPEVTLKSKDNLNIIMNVLDSSGYSNIIQSNKYIFTV